MTMLQHGLVPSTGGYQIERSLRFNSADSATLTRTPGSSGNRKTWTTSFWVKRSALGYKNLLNCSQSIGSSNDQLFQLAFNSSDKLYIFQYNPSTIQMDLQTTAVYRDVSAWYHIVLAYDTTQATASDRVKLYVNGVQVTSFSSATYPSQNSDGYINNTIPHVFGQYAGGSGGIYLDAYIADFHLVDGSALTPSSFGENDTDTGVWKPKAYTGSYGTNGFKLTFSDNSGTTSTTLGKDTSGNGNNWTPNNFSVTAGAGNDSLVDTPTPYGTDTGAGGSVRGNYPTLNPLNASSNMSLSDGNLQAKGTANFFPIAHATMGIPNSGKWYWEYTVYPNSTVNAGVGYMLGIAPITAVPTKDTYIGNTNNGYALWAPDGSGSNSPAKRFNSSNTSLGSAFAMQNGDVLQVAFDAGSGKIWFGRNNTWYEGNPATDTTPSFSSISTSTTWVPAVQPYYDASYTNNYVYLNFGQRPFAYTAPSGFKALCTTNLPTPTIGATSSTRADDYFNIALYTGNNSTNAITGLGFSPDLVWIKSRSNAENNLLFDTNRGRGYGLYSNLTNAEAGPSPSDKDLVSFDSDGFTLGQIYNFNVNDSGKTFVGWAWRGSDSAAVSNTAGSITSTVSANTTAGFSIVTYTGTGANATVGHGLGVAPSMIIVKNRTDGTRDWLVYHASIGNTAAIFLNLTNAPTTLSAYWNNTSPTSSVFSLGNSSAGNGSTNNLVAYCFAPVAGYSAFGSYTGNGSTDGPFVFTGFRPRYLMLKVSSGTTDSWVLLDSARNTYNVTNSSLFANVSNAESTGSGGNVDFLSNGFKLRTADAGRNGNTYTYIYAAFAETPFRYSLAR